MYWLTWYDFGSDALLFFLRICLVLLNSVDLLLHSFGQCLRLVVLPLKLLLLLALLRNFVSQLYDSRSFCFIYLLVYLPDVGFKSLLLALNLLYLILDDSKVLLYSLFLPSKFRRVVLEELCSLRSGPLELLMDISQVSFELLYVGFYLSDLILYWLLP